MMIVRTEEREEMVVAASRGSDDQSPLNILIVYAYVYISSTKLKASMGEGGEQRWI